MTEYNKNQIYILNKQNNSTENEYTTSNILSPNNLEKEKEKEQDQEDYINSQNWLDLKVKEYDEGKHHPSFECNGITTTYIDGFEMAELVNVIIENGITWNNIHKFSDIMFMIDVGENKFVIEYNNKCFILDKNTNIIKYFNDSAPHDMNDSEEEQEQEQEEEDNSDSTENSTTETLEERDLRNQTGIFDWTPGNKRLSEDECCSSKCLDPY